MGVPRRRGRTAVQWVHARRGLLVDERGVCLQPRRQKLQFPYFIICGCLGTVIGQGPIDYYIRLKKKKSWIIYSLAAIIAGSLVALSFAGSLTVYRTWSAGGNMGMAPLCKH